VSEVQVFVCGVKCEHKWDGPGVEFKSQCPDCAELEHPDPDCKICHGTGEWVSGEAATCSLCGTDAMSASLWEGP
jgi:hypothetical protein